MKIDASAGALAPRQVEAQRTPVSRTEVRDAIGRAYARATGRAPAPEALDVLTAHASLETGSGGSMYNFNFGGIKGRSPTGETARCRTREVLGGREVEVRDGFRAYRSLDEGALDYVKLMRGKFGAAMARAEAGDVSGFAHQLKRLRYYTADEGTYARALRGLMGVADGTSGRHDGARAGVPAPAATLFADAPGVQRMLDAVASHRMREVEREVEEDE